MSQFEVTYEGIYEIIFTESECVSKDLFELLADCVLLLCLLYYQTPQLLRGNFTASSVRFITLDRNQLAEKSKLLC